MFIAGAREGEVIGQRVEEQQEADRHYALYAASERKGRANWRQQRKHNPSGRAQRALTLGGFGVSRSEEVTPHKAKLGKES
jgi:hypothetical protein